MQEPEIEKEKYTEPKLGYASFGISIGILPFWLILGALFNFSGTGLGFSRIFLIVNIAACLVGVIFSIKVFRIKDVRKVFAGLGHVFIMMQLPIYIFFLIFTFLSNEGFPTV